MTKNLHSVNIRMPAETHDRMVEVISNKKLKSNINAFANDCIEACLEMIESKEVVLPKFIGVSRYTLQYEPEAIPHHD